jgi:hypothetical protein
MFRDHRERLIVPGSFIDIIKYQCQVIDSRFGLANNYFRDAELLGTPVRFP